jgi:hypothetical protein
VGRKTQSREFIDTGIMVNGTKVVSGRAWRTQNRHGFCRRLHRTESGAENTERVNMEFQAF